MREQLLGGGKTYTKFSALKNTESVRTGHPAGWQVLGGPGGSSRLESRHLRQREWRLRSECSDMRE